MITTVGQALVMACMLFNLCAYSYSVTSIASGSWQSPDTWSTGNVPDATANVVVDHDVWLPAGTLATVASLSIAGHLSLQSGATLRLAAQMPGVSFTVNGVLECADSSVVEGTTASNTRFERGSRYLHRQGPLGFIPLATWDAESTFQISGFVDDGYINLAHSSTWRQSFGNVEYNCPMQSVFVVDLNGHLQDIRGNLIIRSTNNKTLRLSTTQQAIIRIGGNLIVEGPSQVWFTTSSANCVINIGGDFEYKSQATAGSYLATRGNVNLTIRGSWIVDAQSPLRMASSAADSTGSRQAIVSLSGDMEIRRGSLVAPPPGSGRGVIAFNGAMLQRVIISPTASALLGNLEYVFAVGSRVSLGESVLTSDRGAVTANGTLELGSIDPGGALQLGNAGGNIRVPGTRTFSTGSSIVYNGRSKQVIGDGHPALSHTILDNPEGVSLASPVLVRGDLIVMQGPVSQSGYVLTVEGNVVLRQPGVSLDNLMLSGPKDQTLDGNDAIIQLMEVNKTSGAVTLLSRISLGRGLQIHSTGTSIRSNGNLTLLSAGDDAGHTATIATIPGGSSIDGDVTVQRFMSGEGRMYRYISSPVNNATVASLMDDFAVTGTFDDPSTGPGIHSSSPSLFEYDESAGELQEGWKGYPSGGLAMESRLQIGRGYAAFVRNRASTVMDFTGPLNQGDIFVPLGYTMHQGRGNGWHLVGNPYASSVDWDASALVKAGVSNVVAIRDNGARRFRYWDGDDMYVDIPGGRIAPGQSFWVRAMGPGASLTFREDCKAIDAAFFRRPFSPVPSLMISIYNGDIADHAILKLRQQALDSLDAWDGVKLLNDTLNVSTVTPGGNRLAIDSRPALPRAVQLNVTELVPGKYFIRLDAQDTLRELRYLLRDDYLLRTTKILPSDSAAFDVTADTASSRPDRFTLFIDDTIPKRKSVDSLWFHKQRSDSILLPYPNVSAYLHSRSAGESILPDSILEMKSRDVQVWNNLIRLYPNPALTELNVESECGYERNDASGWDQQVELYNGGGIRVAPRTYNVQREWLYGDSDVQKGAGNSLRLKIAIDALMPGEYILKINWGISTTWQRFIKP